MVSADVAKALAIMAQLSGKEFSPDAARMLAGDLAEYPERDVLAALGRCRKELRFFPTLAEIIARIDDGRPGPEEAWAMIPKDEDGSVVWSDEMAEAFDPIRFLIEEDPIAARMAFKESYLKLVTDARARRKPVRWAPSLGHDRHGHVAALMTAVDKGRMSLTDACSHSPELEFQRGPTLQELGFSNLTKRLTGPGPTHDF